MADYQLSYTGDQVNTAIGQIVNKNITGTLTIETLALTNPLAITQGGTGATTAAAARENLGIKSCGTYDILPIAQGGTGKTTAADAAKVLGVGDYCFIKISGDTGAWSTTGGKVETLSIASQQGGYFTDNKNSTFKVNKACKIKTSGTIQLVPAVSGTAVSLEVDLKKGSTDVSYCRVVMDSMGGRSTEAFGTDVITLAAGDVLSFFAKATASSKLRMGEQTRFLFEVIPV